MSDNLYRAVELGYWGLSEILLTNSKNIYQTYFHQFLMYCPMRLTSGPFQDIYDGTMSFPIKPTTQTNYFYHK